MAKALVSAVVEGLGSMAKDEVKLLICVKEEIKKLSRMFTAINAVMEDAERQQVTKTAVRVWLGNLKEVAYEAEDIIDEWRTEASRSQEDEDDFCNKVRSYFLFLCLCFKDVKLHHDIGRRIRKITERLNEISIQKRDFNLNEDNRQEEAESMPVKKERETSSFFDESEIFGRGKEKETIINELTDETIQAKKPISVVSIVGMGGLGKTTLAQLVYNDERVQKHFEKRIWVCVSDPFNVNTVATKIIQSMGEKASGNQDLDTLQGKLREAVGKMRFLLVLDDVWNESDTQWQKLRLPLKGAAQGSKIVITTRHHKVAHIMKTTQFHNLDVLPKSDCLKLFKYTALKGTEDEERQELIEAGEKIVERCNGVPLALRAVGNLLRQRRDMWYWQNVLDSEIWEWDIPKDDHILPALLLSYFSLPLHLRRCFSFCSVFPKDWKIEKDELVQLWMAHGFIKSKEEDMKKIGEMYFDDLVARSLFQNAKEDNDGNIVHCQMHDLVHDLAKFVTTGDSRNMEIGNSELHSVNCHHLSLLMHYDVLTIPSPLCSSERLRTLLLFGMSSIQTVPDSLFKHLRFLRALHFSSTSIQVLPSFIGKLRHLRYLNLCDSKNIKEVPEFVADLCNLQTLKLNNCSSLCTLPSGMSKMVKLRHLGIIKTPKLEFLPNGLGRLTSLQTLSKFPVGDENRGCKIGELKNLNLLGGVLNILNLERVMDGEEANKAELRRKCNLQNLSLHYEFKTREERRILGDDKIKRMESVLEALVPPHSSLKQLEILNYAGSKFPSWLGDSTFSNLVQLTLVGCKKCRLLPGLGKLPSLKCLKIHGADEVQVVGNEFYGNDDDSVTGRAFSKLEELSFDSMLNWAEWKLTEEPGVVMSSLYEGLGNLKVLHTLRILNCPKLAFLPEGLGQMKALQTLEIFKCSQLSSLPEGLGQLTALRTLQISNCSQLSSLPEGLGQLTVLRTLQISNCSQLSSLPEGHGQLTALRTLQISNCSQLSSLPEGLGQLTALRTLQISNCSQLSSLPGGLGQLTALRTLQIVDCSQLSSLPEGLGQLAALRTLQIVDCSQLLCLPDRLGQLTALRALQISNCSQLLCLPEELGQLTALRTLQISYCSQLSSLFEGLRQLTALWTLQIFDFSQLLSLPEGLGQLTALRTLRISDCSQLSSLPEGLGQLTALRTLEISYCSQFSSLPEGLGQLTALRTLQIIDCSQLSCLPKGLGQLTALWTLRIYNCSQLSSLPEGLGQLKALWTLEISNCPQLSSLPEGFRQLIALRTLQIVDCSQLLCLPEGLGQLTALRTLQISNFSQLSSWPEGLGQLKALQTLEISNCPQLSSLPEGLGQLKALQSLEIFSCFQLSSLPEEIGQLKALQTLEISHCPQLSSLAEGLGQLKALQTLKIDRCSQLSSLPEGLGQLTALQALKIGRCSQLSSLPERLGRLKALETLQILNCSQLSSLPEGFGQLKALETLKIWFCCQLSSLPEGLGQLEALQVLDIRACNGLTSIPNGLGQLKSLRFLQVDECPNLKPLPNLQNLTMLEQIGITECPRVTERLEKEKGADWCNISHIPSIWIDGRKIQKDGEVGAEEMVA